MSEAEIAAEGSAPASSADAEWQLLADVDPGSAQFPLRARCGGEAILVLRVSGGFRGIERSCPHQKRPLNDAILQGGDKLVRCRWHSYVFRLSDGKAVNCPGYRLRVFDVKAENGALFVRPAS